jgi:hypothetical protein
MDQSPTLALKEAAGAETIRGLEDDSIRILESRNDIRIMFHRHARIQRIGSNSRKPCGDDDSD